MVVKGLSGGLSFGADLSRGNDVPVGKSWPTVKPAESEDTGVNDGGNLQPGLRPA
jgi:hypothetical protein